MKKIIFILFTVLSFGQAPTNFTYGIKLPNIAQNNGATKVLVKDDATGLVGFKPSSVFGNPFNTNQTNAIISATNPSGVNPFATLLELGNYIPINGTTATGKITGDIEIDGNPLTLKRIFQDGGIGQVTSLEFDSDNSKVRLQSNGTLGNNNIELGDQIFITSDNNPILITQFGVGARGLTGGQDYSQNITNLDYTQKSYVDDLFNSIPAPTGGTVTNLSATNNLGQTWTITNPTTTPNLSLSLTSGAVGLSNVPNVDATSRSNHTGTQLASTISDFTSSARSSNSFVSGSGNYNSTTGVIAIPTNTNELTNGAGFITGITGANVTTALGYTPYNATNPSGYISSVPAQTFASLTSKPTTLSGYGITDAYPLTGNPSGFLTSSALTPYLTSATASTTYQTIGSYLTSFTETDPIVRSISGIVKSNGTTISSAIANTDYALPNAVNTNYANDYRAGNFVAGTNYVSPSGSGASLTGITATQVGAVASNALITGATNTKITYDAKGLVTSGTTLSAGDIPNLAQSQVINLTTDLASKQATLVSGTNLRTVNGNTLLGSTDILVQSPITLTTTGTSGASTFVGNTLNIPNYASGGGSTWGGITGTLSAQTDLQTALNDKLTVANPTFTGQLKTGTLSYTPTNAIATLQSNVAGFNQFIIQNTSTATNASSDVIVNNNNSTDTTFYGDFGMNSSTFTGTGAFFQPNNVYLTSTSSDLAIGTTTNNPIHFVVNSSATDAMTINTNGSVAFNGQVGTSGQVLQSNGTTAPTWVNPAGGASETFVPLASNFPSTVVTEASVTGWSFPVVAGKTYRVEVIASVQSVATTTGVELGYFLSAGGVGSIIGFAEGSILQTNVATELRTPIRAIGAADLAGSNLITSGVGVVNSPHDVYSVVKFNCTTSGTFNVGFASEVAASSAQINAGSALIYKALN